MKHYLLSPEGLQRIADKDVEGWRLHGSFMNAEGPVTIPVALGQPDADNIELLLKKAENFVYWFTPDYRVVLTTKPRVRGPSTENGWKMRFEVRGQDRDGKACIQTGRIDGKIHGHGVVKVIAEVFANIGRQHIAPVAQESAEASGEGHVPAEEASAPPAT